MEKNVIIAENDENVRVEIKNILENNGYNVISVVDDGIDTISTCLNNENSIVFMQNNLPVIDGFYVTSCLRSKGYCGYIFIMAKNYDEEKEKRALDSGADGYLIKPLTEKFLIPWLQAKIARTEDIKYLKKEKDKLLSELESKRIIEEANGMIASSLDISFAEADKLLETKAKQANIEKQDLAKMLLSKS